MLYGRWFWGITIVEIGVGIINLKECGEDLFYEEVGSYVISF